VNRAGDAWIPRSGGEPADRPAERTCRVPRLQRRLPGRTASPRKADGLSSVLSGQLSGRASDKLSDDLPDDLPDSPPDHCLDDLPAPDLWSDAAAP